MMRSLFSGVSGLRVHQSRMDVIGNNIANVNTVGFKAARMTFADAMSQRISGASADNPVTGRAGRNPMQIGLGVNVGGIDNLMLQGAAQRTDRPLDLTIQGNGFFIVSDSSGTFFTRAGNVDWNGQSFSIGGMRLMGWPAVPDDNNPGQFIIQPGQVAPLETGPEVMSMNPSPTTLVETIGNLNVHDLTVDPTTGLRTVERPVTFFDTLGNRYQADVRFTYFPADHTCSDYPGVISTNTAGLWRFEFLDRGTERDNDPADANVTVFPGGIRIRPDGSCNGIRIGIGVGLRDDDGNLPANLGQTGYLVFNPQNGRLIGIADDLDDLLTVTTVPTGTGAAGPGVIITPGDPDDIVTTITTGGLMDWSGTDAPQGPREIVLVFNTLSNPLLPPAIIGGPPMNQHVGLDGNVGEIRMCFRGLRQQSGEPTGFRMNFADGNAPGSLTDVMIGPDGIITGRYSNGQTRPLGQIPLFMPRNPAGMERMGNNLWATSQNSGEFDGVGDHGDMMPGTLEMSNVDLSSEFTEMITTQRGFQANSRVITTSDEMLQELVNLRR